MHDLQNIMRKLRSPQGCEWDIKQTHESLKKYLIEEAYEIAQAIDNDDIDELIEELGDVLLQVIFLFQIFTCFIKFIHIYINIFKNMRMSMY